MLWEKNKCWVINRPEKSSLFQQRISQALQRMLFRLFMVNCFLDARCFKKYGTMKMMLLASFVCFIIAAIAAVFSYKLKHPTLVLISKIVLHLFIFLFMVLLIMALINTLPPPPKDNTLLPV